MGQVYRLNPILTMATVDNAQKVVHNYAIVCTCK